MTRRHAMLLLLSTLAAACGRKTRLRPPEDVRPTAPDNIIAKAVPEGLLLSWSRPTEYTGGDRMRDLARFEVQRAVDRGGPLAYEMRTNFELTDRFRFQKAKRIEWTDTDVVEGQRYLYRVIAITADEDRSDPGGPIAVDYHRPPPAPPKAQPATPAP